MDGDRSDMDGMKRLREIALELRETRIAYSRLNWAKYTTGFDFGVNDAYRELHSLLKDPLSWVAWRSTSDCRLRLSERMLRKAYIAIATRTVMTTPKVSLNAMFRPNIGHLQWEAGGAFTANRALPSAVSTGNGSRI